MEATTTGDGGGLSPGRTVELHSLTRGELNGTRGVCRAYDSDTCRWEVMPFGGGHQDKPLGVKPINLRTVASRRADAARALCDILRERYPLNGLKIHPALSFEVDEGGGICIRTTAEVDVGEILLVVPEDVCISKQLAACSTSSMLSVLADVRRLWDASSIRRGYKHIALSNVEVVVCIMHVVCRADDDVQVRVVVVWPSMDELRDQQTVLWSNEKLESIRGTCASRYISRLRDELHSIFEHVIEPALGKASIVEEGLFHREGTTLRDLFYYAFGISYSRVHGDDDMNIKPLIDLFNGTNLAGINVEVNTGKWPFLHGHIFRDDCNLNVSGVAATRPLRAGEDLIIEYGSLRTSFFFVKYGVVPRPIQKSGNGELDVIECILPPDLKPHPTDVHRIRAIRDIFGLCDILGYRGFESGHGFELRMSDLVVFQRGHEPDRFKGFRQLCVLLIGGDQDIRAFCDCNGSRFRFNFKQASLVRVFKRIFNHNLKLLAPFEGEHVVREIERRGFQAWRKAVLDKYDPFY
jgi:hypothetical protein